MIGNGPELPSPSFPLGVIVLTEPPSVGFDADALGSDTAGSYIFEGFEVFVDLRAVDAETIVLLPYSEPLVSIS